MSLRRQESQATKKPMGVKMKRVSLDARPTDVASQILCEVAPGAEYDYGRPPDEVLEEKEAAPGQARESKMYQDRWARFRAALPNLSPLESGCVASYLQSIELDGKSKYSDNEISGWLGIPMVGILKSTVSVQPILSPIKLWWAIRLAQFKSRLAKLKGHKGGYVVSFLRHEVELPTYKNIGQILNVSESCAKLRELRARLDLASKDFPDKHLDEDELREKAKEPKIVAKATKAGLITLNEIGLQRLSDKAVASWLDLNLSTMEGRVMLAWARMGQKQANERGYELMIRKAGGL